ncbi:MAG: methyltransferase domain-containing protein [Acidobacteriota bacterium]
MIPPSPFVVEWAAALAPELRAPRRLLDVAMGRGRHALACAGLGYRVFGVDVNIDAVRAAAAEAERRGLSIRAWCADLIAAPLPVGRFEAVVVTRYLQRDLFGPIRHAVTPGGIVLYETFTSNQRAHGTGPTSADHLLEPGELRDRFDAFDILFYEEVRGPEAVARIAARRPLAPSTYAGSAVRLKSDATYERAQRGRSGWFPLSSTRRW